MFRQAAMLEILSSCSIHLWLLILPGPPGPPVDCQVTEVTETTASLSWAPGLENYSPILSYTIQARTLFFLGWQAVTTGRLVLSKSMVIIKIWRMHPRFLPTCKHRDKISQTLALPP